MLQQEEAMQSIQIYEQCSEKMKREIINGTEMMKN